MTDLAGREGLEDTIRAHGFSEGTSPHSWRCEEPVRYPGYCTCVSDLASGILASPWLAAHDAEIVAKAEQRTSLDK